MNQTHKTLLAGGAVVLALTVGGVAASTGLTSIAQNAPTQGQLSPEDAQRALQEQQDRQEAFENQQPDQNPTAPVEQQQPSIQPNSQPALGQDTAVQNQQAQTQANAYNQGQVPNSGPSWNGEVFTASTESLEGPSGYESPVAYDLDGDVEVIDGIVYEDGKVVVYYNTNVRPTGSTIQTSLGEGIIRGHLDIAGDPTHVGIAVQ